MTHYFHDVTNEEDFDYLTEHSNVCVVDFYAQWCGPCKTLTAALEKKIGADNVLATNTFKHGVTSVNNLNRHISFIKVNVDNFEDLAAKFEVSSLPHVVFYSNGALTTNVVNGCNPDKVLDIVRLLAQ